MGLFSFFKRDKEKATKDIESSSIEIDVDKCGGCGRCVSVCPNNSFEIIEGKSTLKDDFNCRECKVCLAACSIGAIKFIN